MIPSNSYKLYRNYKNMQTFSQDRGPGGWIRTSIGTIKVCCPAFRRHPNGIYARNWGPVIDTIRTHHIQDTIFLCTLIPFNIDAIHP